MKKLSKEHHCEVKPMWVCSALPEQIWDTNDRRRSVIKFKEERTEELTGSVWSVDWND